MNRLHDLFKIRDERGDVILIVALGEEKQSDVSRRVQAAGGSANVVVVPSTGDVSIVTVKKFDNQENLNVDNVEVHADITMDMFLTYLKNNPGRPVNVVANGGSVQGQLQPSAALAGAR